MPLWILSGIFVLAFIMSLLVREYTFDLNIHDTYYVISSAIFFQFFTVWFTLCGVGYLVLKRYGVPLVFGLTFLHLLVSILVFLPLCLPDLFTIVDYNFKGINNSITIYKIDTHEVRMMAILILFVAQIVYFFNILISTIRKISFRK